MSDEFDSRLLRVEKRTDVHEDVLFGRMIADENGMHRSPGLLDRLNDLTLAITQALNVIKWGGGIIGGAIVTVATAFVVAWLQQHH